MNAEIEKQIVDCVNMLHNGGYVIFPSEIGWSIGCDAANNENILAILNSDNYQLQAILLEEPGKLIKYVKDFPDAGYDMVEFATKPLHLIIDDLSNLPAEALKYQKELSFRIAKDEFTLALLKKYGKPIFAAHIVNTSQPVKTVSVLNKSCFVVNLRASSKSNPDHLAVFKFSNGGKIEIIRK